MMAAGRKGTVIESYFIGPNRKPGHWQWDGKEAGISERGFGGQYHETLRLIDCEVRGAVKN